MLVPGVIAFFVAFLCSLSCVTAARCPLKPNFVSSATSVGVPNAGGACPVNTVCINDAGTDKCFACTDTNTKCADLKINGYCANQAIDFEIRAKNCAKTCAFCDSNGEYFQTEARTFIVSENGYCPPDYILGAFGLCLEQEQVQTTVSSG
ncbi:unnamed protein product, partial [Mesorhabditis belari]|uniref:ShKT domain-containing protein n=1 Tax=Mesorhabditis belari TaxID=2138241 RepID=A0AAF3FN28_9BILA